MYALLVLVLHLAMVAGLGPVVEKVVLVVGGLVPVVGDLVFVVGRLGPAGGILVLLVPASSASAANTSSLLLLGEHINIRSS